MFEDISIIDNGKVVSIHLKPVSNFKYFEESSMYSSLLDKVNFEINIPYKVIDGNYDKEENRVYTWTINKGESLKGINISYSTNENIIDKIPLSIWIISSIIFVILLISVYVYIKYKFCKPDTIPFVDTVEVTLVSPTEVKIEVYEKDVIGYLYVDATGQNAYIDRDGIVEELSTRIIDGAIEIKGLNVGEVTLYETLQTDNRNLFKNLLSLTNTLRKYHISPSVITVKDDSRFYLTCGDVKVNFGTATDLNDKIVRLEKILPQLEGMKGELHLEEWENENSDITFEKKSSKKNGK